MNIGQNIRTQVLGVTETSLAVKHASKRNLVTTPHSSGRERGKKEKQTRTKEVRHQHGQQEEINTFN